MKNLDGPRRDDPDSPRYLTRRSFVVGSLAAGFALAVLPVSAETITTDGKGLVVGEIEIPVAGGEIPGYRAMPAAGGPFATVLVVHEIFGVHEHIKDICRRLAKLGYFAVAPALFAREGNVARMTDIQQSMQVVAKVPDRQVAADLDATVAWAKSTGHADTQKLGIVGFCWGGCQVWLYGAHNPNLRAGVAWYGLLGRPNTELTPESPLDLVTQINVPVLGLYGGADAAIPMSQIDQMRADLKARGQAVRDRGLSRYPAWIQRGLPPEFSASAGTRRMEADGSMVQGSRGRLGEARSNAGQGLPHPALRVRPRRTARCTARG